VVIINGTVAHKIKIPAQRLSHYLAQSRYYWRRAGAASGIYCHTGGLWCWRAIFWKKSNDPMDDDHTSLMRRWCFNERLLACCTVAPVPGGVATPPPRRLCHHVRVCNTVFGQWCMVRNVVWRLRATWVRVRRKQDLEREDAMLRCTGGSGW